MRNYNMQNNSSHSFSFLKSSNNPSSYRQCFLSTSFLQICRVFCLENASESSSTLISVGCVCVLCCMCVLCVDIMCCVCTCTPHVHTCHVFVCVRVFYVCLCVFHAHDWMHTSVYVGCVHMHVGTCLCVCMYISGCYTPWLPPICSSGSPGPHTFHDS